MSIKEYFFNCCYSILVSWLLRFSIKLVEFCKKIEKHINVLSLLTNNWKTKLSNFRFFSLIAVVFFSINIFSLKINFSNIATRINLSSENFPKELEKQQYSNSGVVLLLVSRNRGFFRSRSVSILVGGVTDTKISFTSEFSFDLAVKDCLKLFYLHQGWVFGASCYGFVDMSDLFGELSISWCRLYAEVVEVFKCGICSELWDADDWPFCRIWGRAKYLELFGG